MRDSGRVVAIILAALVVVIGIYWALWYGDRPLVASEGASYYQNFESAFPLADGLLAAAMLGTASSLWRHRPTAILFGLMATGGGIYLFGMDVLFDVEHGIWGRGGGGIIELCINVVTVLASAFLGWWMWENRATWDAPMRAVEPGEPVTSSD